LFSCSPVHFLAKFFTFRQLCRRTLQVRAGFFDNFGKSDEAAKDAEFQRQQEVLAARRSGKSLDKALERREKLKKVGPLPIPTPVIAPSNYFQVEACTFP
jgi:hypothetical protein